MDNTKPSYSLCFKGCKEQANQTELRKIAITLVNIVSHEIYDDSLVISFTDAISCQMAKDILGDDWHFITETGIIGTYVKDFGFKIQNHFFTTLSEIAETPDDK